MTEDQFIRGQPLTYVGLDGHTYVARFLLGSGLHYVEVRDVSGRKKSSPIMSEREARSFYANATKEHMPWCVEPTR